MSIVNFFALHVILALAWAALSGSLTPEHVVAGFVMGYILLWLSRRALGPTQYFSKVPQIIGFGLFFLRELVKANVRVAIEVISPVHHMKPGIVAIPLDLKTDLEITTLANLITLTPGTLSLDVSDDRRVLYVHSMFVDDPDDFRREIKDGFERRVHEVFN